MIVWFSYDDLQLIRLTNQRATLVNLVTVLLNLALPIAMFIFWGTFSNMAGHLNRSTLYITFKFSIGLCLCNTINHE